MYTAAGPSRSSTPIECDRQYSVVSLQAPSEASTSSPSRPPIDEPPSRKRRKATEIEAMTRTSGQPQNSDRKHHTPASYGK